jgi:hypothetical protein
MIRLTYAMLPSEELFDSMLAPEDGNLYGSVVKRIYSAPNAFTRIGNYKEIYEKD